jgi:DNA-binding NtrC family response regulator
MKAPRRTLLLVEDDTLLCRAVHDALSSESLEVLAVHTAADGLATCSERRIDIAVLDQHLPDGDGRALCGRILAVSAEAKIVFITAYPSFDSAVTVLKAGAHDYLCKPFSVEELGIAVRRCLGALELERVERLEAYRAVKDRQESMLVGGAGLDALRELVALAARAEAPVLVTGETGTGKTLVAKAIHFGGSRRDGPFITLDCAALPEHLIEAELFGWDRGAFTGAVDAREGVIAMAEGGTLFLDEIGEMPLHLQAKLLNVLEGRQVRRIGGRTSRTVDFRLVAATNASLEEHVERGAFRADLFFRLDVVRIRMPPLRERTADLAPLCEHLLRGIAGRNGAQLAPGEIDRLAGYAWPGNVRELRNVLERSLVLHRDTLRPSELLGPAQQRPGDATRPRTPLDGGGPELTLEEVELRHVRETLRRHSGNLTRAARALGISLSTLKRKVKLARIEPARSK